eukprot:6475371-Amphidinium_carterae.1
MPSLCFSWRSWWQQLTPQIVLLCSALAWLNASSWRALQLFTPQLRMLVCNLRTWWKLTRKHFAWLATCHILLQRCTPRATHRSLHPLRGVRIGEATNPGPAHRLPKKTTTTAAQASAAMAGTSSLRSDSGRCANEDTVIDCTQSTRRSASAPPNATPQEGHTPSIVANAGAQSPAHSDLHMEEHS